MRRRLRTPAPDRGIPTILMSLTDRVPPYLSNVLLLALLLVQIRADKTGIVRFAPTWAGAARLVRTESS